MWQKLLQLVASIPINTSVISKKSGKCPFFKVCLVKAMFFFFFPVVRYGCETWTIKKAECPQIVAFELWCWRRGRDGWMTAHEFEQTLGTGKGQGSMLCSTGSWRVGHNLVTEQQQQQRLTAPLPVIWISSTSCISLSPFSCTHMHKHTH